MLSLYHRYKENKTTNIGLKDLCTQDALIYDSLKQVSDAAKGLKDEGYIKLTLFIGNDGHISGLTPTGIEYVEENLLSQEELLEDGLSDSTKIIDSDQSLQIDLPNNEKEADKTHENKESQPVNYFIATEKYKPIVDTDATPCFGVDSVVDCYAKQLDKIALSKTESTRMLGIFGPWGRGKTYFFKRLRKNLEEKSLHTLKYKIIEFNAWKYQETPALWAYLYETIYNAASWKEKIYAWGKQVLKNFLTIDTVLYLAIWGTGWCLGWLAFRLAKAPDIQLIENIKILTSVSYGLSGISYFLKKNTATAKNIVKKYTQKKSYKSHLGVQNEIEEDLQTLLESIVCNPKKTRVILYVDDIDRCCSQKMNNLIESLRTVLENPKIQDRLIVICSIDENKILNAYYNDLENKHYDNAKIKQLAREQLDKLFIFGVKLAALDTTQLELYLHSLVKDSNFSEEIEVEAEQNQEESFRIFRKKDSSKDNYFEKKFTNLNDENIEKLFQEFLINHATMLLTPRKIRIMYYQLLFGLNLASKGGGVFTNSIVETMLEKSAGLPYEEKTEAEMSNIIEMVVPY